MELIAELSKLKNYDIGTKEVAKVIFDFMIEHGNCKYELDKSLKLYFLSIESSKYNSINGYITNYSLTAIIHIMDYGGELYINYSIHNYSANIIDQIDNFDKYKDVYYFLDDYVDGDDRIYESATVGMIIGRITKSSNSITKSSD